MPHCSLLTSFGSNPNSWFLYPRTKGELETSVKGLEFSYTSIFRPGLLGRGESARLGEKIVSKWPGLTIIIILLCRIAK